MTPADKTYQQLLAENDELRMRLEEAKQTLRAIGDGEVDAFVVGECVFTLQGADLLYRVMVESMDEGAATLSQDGTLVYCNSRFSEMLQIPQHKLVGTRFDSYLSPADQPRFETHLESCWQKPSKVEITLLGGSGTTLPAQMSVSSLFHNGNRLICILITDISERIRADYSLRESEDNFKYVFENSVIGKSITLPTGELNPNRALCQMLGYSREELSQLTWRDITHPLDIELTRNEIDSLLSRQKDSARFEKRYIHKNGSIVWGDLSTSVRFDPEGRALFFLTSVIDITERKKIDAARSELLNRLQRISASVPGVVYQYRLRPDGSSCFPFASETIRSIYHVTPEEVRDDATKVFAVLHPDDYDGIVASIQTSAHTLSPWRYEYRVKFDDGTVNWLSGNALPEREADGSVLWHGFITDITEKKGAEVQLLQAKAAAESANIAKSEFLANMSHEIRTPLNGVLGMVQLLEMTPLTEEQQEYVAALKLSGKGLTSLISDILDLSKIEAGKIEIEMTDFSLRQCLREIVLMHKSATDAKGLILTMDVADDIPAVVTGDQLRIKQILNNIVGNAVKFTSEGSVTISARLVERREAFTYIQIAVRDTGIGISPEAIEKIFKPFTQEDGSITRRYGGTGLGLTISRRLVELMDGELTVECSSGSGCCFSVTLPLTIVNTSGVVSESIQNKACIPDTPPLRILYVEDNPVNIKFGHRLLSKLGHTVVPAENGRECLEALKQGTFDLVLMDIQMPVMGGEEAVLEIRRKEQGSGVHLPVIALTGYALRGDKERFIGDGFDGYVTKPLSVAELVREINRVMGVTEPSAEVQHD